MSKRALSGPAPKLLDSLWGGMDGKLEVLGATLPLDSAPVTQYPVTICPPCRPTASMQSCKADVRACTIVLTETSERMQDGV